MSSSMELDGLDNIVSRIESMGKAGSKLEGTALKLAGNIMLEEAKNNLESNSNVRTGKLRDNLEVSGVKRKGNKKYVMIGIQKGDNSNIFYGKFLEWGTSKMSANPFLGPAFVSKKSEAKELIMNELRRGLGL